MFKFVLLHIQENVFHFVMINNKMAKIDEGFNPGICTFTPFTNSWKLQAYRFKKI